MLKTEKIMLKLTKLRMILWGILGVTIFVLLWLKLVPTGEITYTQDFGGKNEFLSKLTPAERVKEKDRQVMITGDPVYFTLRTPRPFREAEVTFVYNTQGENASLIEAGILMSESSWRYKTKPVQNKMIDRLSSVWNVTREGKTILLQKEKQFNSIKEFYRNLPPVEEFALYNYKLDQNYILPDYRPASEFQRFDIPLRGGYEFFTYLKDEKMEFRFVFFDINRNREQDDFYLDLYYNDKLLQSKHIKGDGISSDSKEVNEVENGVIDLKDMPEGIYKVEVRANDDIVTKSIKTAQKKLSFISRLQLADPSVLEKSEESHYPALMYFSGSKINAKTIYPADLQTIQLGDEDAEDLVVEETYKKFSQNIAGNPKKTSSTKVLLEKGGIILSGDGNFAFSSKALLEPGYNRIKSSDDITDELNFILADYIPPEEKGRWKTKTVKFDLEEAFAEKEYSGGLSRKYRFMISAPGISKDRESEIEINKIQVKLKGESLWGRLGIR
jgi:hypothetical protein